MTTDDALRFLAAHQPMPDTVDCSDALVAEFEVVRSFLESHPDERAVPLLLGAFGGGDLHGVYVLVEDALRPYPAAVVVPRLAEALTRGGASVRYWGAQIAASFPDPRLVAPLAAILETGDMDQRFAAITALAQIKSPETRHALRAAAALPLEPEVRQMLEALAPMEGGG